MRHRHPLGGGQSAKSDDPCWKVPLTGEWRPDPVPLVWREVGRDASAHVCGMTLQAGITTAACVEECHTTPQRPRNQQPHRNPNSRSRHRRSQPTDRQAPVASLSKPHRE